MILCENMYITKRKICVITGASSGIGKATALALASKKFVVILVCRNRTEGENTKKEIIKTTGNKRISLMLADFTSLKSIKQLADNIKVKYKHVDILINNAGVLYSKRTLTQDKYETTFQVNYLAPFFLTLLLINLLKNGATSRIINITSDEHVRGHIDFDNLHGEKKYSGYGAYARSKLALILFTYKLAEKLENTKISVNCVHPGSVATNIGRNSTGLMGIYFKMGKRFMLKPEEGCKRIVYLAISRDVEGVTGKYFINNKAVSSSRLSYNKQLSNLLWLNTIKLIRQKIDFDNHAFNLGLS